MPFASGARSGFSYVAETTFGVTPASPSMKALRVKPGVKPDLKRETFQSKEVRNDRQIVDLRYGTKQGSLEVPFELSYGAFDDFLEAALGGTWTTNVLKAGTAVRSFTFEANQADLGRFEQMTGSIINSFSLAVKPNAVVEGSFGFICKDMRAPETLAASVTVAATGKTFTRAAGSWLDDGFAVGDNVTFSGFSNGGNNATFNISALTTTVMTCSTATGLVNEGPVSVNALLATLGAASAAATNSPYGSFTGTISEGGTAIATVTGIDLKFENSFDPAFVLMADTAQDMVPGMINLTGSVSMYWQNQTFRRKFLSGASSSLTFTLGATSKTLQFNVPKIYYTANERAYGEGAIIETLPIQAVLDTVSGSNFVITRTP